MLWPMSANSGRDMWQYVSMTYFTQTVIATEVGSSAMPHKVAACCDCVL